MCCVNAMLYPFVISVINELRDLHRNSESILVSEQVLCGMYCYGAGVSYSRHAYATCFKASEKYPNLF